MTIAPGNPVRNRVLMAALALLACLLPAAVGEAALLNQVYSGTVSLPNSATPTQVALTGVDISRAFVLCSTRTANANAALALYTCDLNNGGSGGAARLTITPAVAPGNTTTRVYYYVAEFTAGVSVQRGTTTFSNTSLTPSAAPSLTAVDCTKSFVLTSVRTTDNDDGRDELWGVRATLGTAASPCTTTTSNLELTRLEGRNGTTVTVAWEVVTYDGAAVQRGTSCIGGSSATPACPTAGGATNGRNNRVTLGTAVDTSKSFILLTRQVGTSNNGVEGEHQVRAEFLTTGASVTGVEFERALTVTGNNRQVQISYEVVTLNDGSTVQSSGTSPTSITSGTTTSSPNLTTVVDTTRTVLFFSTSGGGSGSANRLDDLSLTGAIAGSNGSQSEVVFTRLTSGVTATVAWFAVSFFRCNTPSGVAYDTVCTVGASTAGTSAAVHWSSVNPVLIVAGGASITFTPTNGTSYTAGQTVTGGATVFYSGTSATVTSAGATGLTPGTTYYFKVWAKAGPVGTCATAPCYVGGTQGTVTPRTNTTWSSFVAGGATLNPAVAGTGRVSFASNAGKLISVDSSTGQWTSVPANTVSPVQGYVTVFSYNGSEAVVGGDQSGWVYSVDQATGQVYWIAKLNADAIQAPLSIYSRELFGANPSMSSTFPGTYDIIVAATANNTASGGFTNNKVFALRSDTGAVLWTFSPSTLGSPCPCPMDQVVGQPWVDIERARVYVTSGSGAGGTQDSIWIIDLLDGGLVARFQGGDIVNGPVQSTDLNSLWVGNQAGVLNIVDLNALTRTTNSVASGLVYKGFIWEDFTTPGRLYFVTTDGFVRALDTPTSSSFAWSTRPVAGGTVSQLLPGFTSLWVGGSNGRLYQLNLTTGAQEGSAFVVGAGTLSVGPVTTENGTEAGGDLLLATSDGTVYKVTLAGDGSLP